MAAHRVFLACVSDYFRGMFTRDMAEKHLDEITLNDISSEGLRAVITASYEGYIDLSFGNVQQVLAAASHLRLEMVEQSCSEFLLSQLLISNCLEFMNLADHFNLTELFKAAMKLIRDHFLRVSDSYEFLSQDVEPLLEILKQNDLNVASEEDVLNSVIRWIKHEPEKRIATWPKLLEWIQFRNFRATVSLFRNFSRCDVNSIASLSGDCLDLPDAL